MFEDLFPDGKIGNKPIKDSVCPQCGSANVEFVSGIFLSSSRYMQMLKCNDCSAEWKVVYDGKLNIIPNI